jgi:tRNA(Ile)-lysidine synthase
MLDPLTIERALSLSGRAALVVALSGGGDSVALLHLLKERLGASPLHALVVDHALRDGSVTDAAKARDFAQELGVSSEVLTVDWRGVTKRSQAAARAARYEILCARARELGARVIAVAHTADDQMETVFMRAGAGSSWRGVAGMAPLAPAPAWPAGRGVWLARPLLKQRRGALRAFLDDRGAGWIEDTANTNTAFERVRARARLAELERAGADPMRLARLADRIRPHVERLDWEASKLIAAAVRFEDGAVSVARQEWHASLNARRRALSVLIAAASGAPREPAADAVERLDARMEAADFAGGSLGGARVSVGGDVYRIDRDPGALSGRAGGAQPIAPLPLAPGRSAVWDGRLALCVHEPGWSVVVSVDGPRLARGSETRPISALVADGAATWLLRRRVAHLLAQED